MENGAMADRDEETEARITNQFRSRDAMVYDLSCGGGSRLTITMAADSGDEWRAEAHARQSPDRPSVVEKGATRGAALDALARAWTAKNGAWGFPPIDWNAVAKALRAVRAI
jgi:hypothetical protein